MIAVIGINHKSAPVALRERVAISKERLSEVILQLQQTCQEVVVLSTCNRTEIYFSDHLMAEESVRAFFCQACSLPADQMESYLYIHRDQFAIRHLFTVAGGLDSMALGEPQILGQVKYALQTAQAVHAIHANFLRLFQQALHVGKQVRSETGIAQRHLSIGQAAADLARSFFNGNGVNPRQILIIGAGEIASQVAKSLSTNGWGPVIVANRTFARAQSLAAELGGKAIHFSQINHYLSLVDVVVCASAAPHIILSSQQIASKLAARRKRPLFLIDIAVPRDIDIQTGNLPGVQLYNIDDLQGVCQAARQFRQQQADIALQIIHQQTQEYLQWLETRRNAPLLSQLQQNAESIRRTEVQKTIRRLENLTPQQQQAIHALSRALTKKLLRAPILHLQSSPSTWPCAQYAQCIAHTLDIPKTPDSTHLKEERYEIQHSGSRSTIPASSRG